MTWLEEAAALPVAFAQVREDSRLDVAMVRRGQRVLMVASGGETAVCLARFPLLQLVVVDVNPAQLALVRCKEWLARNATRQQALEWLGHLECPDRAQRIAATLDALGLPQDALGPLERVAEWGPDQAGRYELLFAALRRELAALVGERAVEAALLRVPHKDSVPSFERNEEAAADGLAVVGPALEVAFERVMSLENLVELFGEGATQNPRQPFARHFLERTLAALTGPAENPFLWQVLAGRFPRGSMWDWLGDWVAPQVPLEYVCAPMLDALEGGGSFDLVHLSNILDWLTPEEATRTLRAAYEALRPGGMVSVRQLNSSLDIPALPSGFRWSRVTEHDRSFFYLALHVGRKP